MSRVRRTLTLVHRWTGLALAAFLVVIAATGAILPFQTELERLIAPERFVAAPSPTAQPLDWLTLHRIAEARSGGIATTLILHRDGDAAPAYGVVAAPDWPPLGFDEIVLDPYTGREIARDTDGDLGDGPAQIIPFLFRVHQNLALGDWGTVLVGVVALAWTLDCFVGFYLTLPAERRRWWPKWGRAWRLRLPATTGFRFAFDLHRAAGLWLWPMLFVFAWSGVALDLPQVYVPVMRVVIGLADPDPPSQPEVGRPPALDWPHALAAARARVREVAARQGVRIERERELRYVTADHRYAYALRTSRDKSDNGANTWLYLDADTGQPIMVAFPTGTRAGNTIDTWLGYLHEAMVFGLPYRIFVSFVAIAVVGLTTTGVLIWLRKRTAKRWRSDTLITVNVAERTKQ
ncbi:PepSY-associated TM helix domain-containing protein [Sphingomonas bacterium]|uniref:PepSY-associated TM helix domain-containing protein n=1 Tax=Sphingomonas bacterium TaxID=1895847 RepID=UPI001576EB86|nr:PepSY-associated TM helix domain-containing protein [Sphingomonas bacterium]